MSQVPLAGQRNPCVVNNSLNTTGTSATPYLPTSVERPWCASHSAATPATCAAAYEVPELRLTSNVPRGLRLRPPHRLPGRRDVDIAAARGRHPALVRAVRGGDRDHFVVAGREHDERPLVARRGDENQPGVRRVLDRIVQHERRQRTAEAHRDDVRVVRHRVIDRVREARPREMHDLVRHPQRNQRRERRDAGHAP